MQKKLEESEERLITTLITLEHSFPSDGWDGAAEAIAAHIRNINRIEEELLQIHLRLGRHRPDIDRYWRDQMCVCGREKDSPLGS